MTKTEIYQKAKAKNYRQCCKIVQKICLEHHEKLKFQDRKNKEEYHSFLQVLEQDIKTEIKKAI